MPRKRIVIVNDGTFKSNSHPDYYQSYIDLLKINMEKAKLRHSNDEPEATVTVVESTEEAKHMVVSGEADIVIFVSADMYKKACELLCEFQNLKVVVLAGKAVKGQPYLIPKPMLQLESIERIMFIY